MATAIVTRQVTDQFDFTNPSNPVPGVIIYFQTGAGNDGSVFVPQSHYTVKNVHAAVAAAAKVLDEVGALSVSYTV